MITKVINPVIAKIYYFIKNYKNNTKKLLYSKKIYHTKLKT